MNKKRMEKAQFEELHVVEKKPDGREEVRIVKKQKEVEWEVRNFYWNLYKEQESNVNINEILENITKMKKVSQDDKLRLDERITGEEECNTKTKTM